MSIKSTAKLGTRILDYVKSFAPLVPVFIYLVIATIGNLDLTNGRFALFMDERVTFDGVRAILDSESFPELVYSISDGGDHRYGRILWNSMALVSFIPELLFGEVGQIVASRILQTVLLAIAVSLLAFGLLRNWATRGLFTFVALCIPYMSYYSSMPKPEPLQVLLISIYFFISFRNNQKKLFGLHWILLGLAFGVKISTLPAVGIILVLALVSSVKTESAKIKFNSGLAFLAGLGLAVPILLPPMALAIAMGWFYQKFDRGNFRELNYSIALSAFLSVAFFSHFANFSRWAEFTFLNTAHGSDQSDINFVSWFSFLVSEWISSNLWLSVLLLVSCILVIAIAVVFASRKGTFFSPEILAPLTIILSGTALSISIMISAQRLWGMYLFPGAFLQLIGVFMLLELYLPRGVGTTRLERITTVSSAVLVAVSLTLTSSLSWSPKTLEEHRSNSQRTLSVEFKSDYKSYIELEEFLDGYQITESRRLVAVIAPGVFHRETDSRFDVREFFGPFTYWDEPIDLIVLAKANTPDGAPYSEKSPEFAEYLLEQEGYRVHVSTQASACSEEPCWRMTVQLTNGGQVLVRDDNK